MPDSGVALSTQLPFLVVAIVIAIEVEPRVTLNPLVCVLMVIAYALACQVVIALGNLLTFKRSATRTIAGVC